MNILLKLSHLIDAMNEKLGRWAQWLILAAVIISTANAIVRKAFNYSSNGLLEIQWYLFAGVFLFGAAYTLMHNEHVRIDVISGRFSKRTQTWIEVFGTVFFLLPMTLMILWLSVHRFHAADAAGHFRAGEAPGIPAGPHSGPNRKARLPDSGREPDRGNQENAGGAITWPNF